MSCLFYKCSSLIDLKFNKFNTNNESDMTSMFYGCPYELNMKIKEQCKNIKAEAF